MPSGIAALTYNKSRIKSNRSHSKAVTTPTSDYIQSSPVKNDHMTSAQSRSKPTTNGYHPIRRTYRLNSKTDQITRTNRRTSKERHDGDL